MSITVGTLATVVDVSSDRLIIYVRFASNRVFSLRQDVPFDLEKGDSIFVSNLESDPVVEESPLDSAGIDTVVATVSGVLDDSLLVKESAYFTRLRTEDLETFKVGDVVEFTELDREPRLISSDISIEDLGVSKPIDSSRFRVDLSQFDETYDDFGGYSSIVQRFRHLTEKSSEEADSLNKLGVAPVTGLLLSGPPGVGKTMLARIAAKQMQIPLYLVNGPEVMSMWFGESERTLREVFEAANEDEQAMIFFDEIDSIAPRRTHSSHEASNRVVSQLLTLVDGFSKNSGVLIIAATNRPDSIDDALRRHGRLGHELGFPLPSLEDREAILAVSAKNYTFESEPPHSRIAELTDSWSPAELSSIWQEGARLASIDGRSRIYPEDYVGGYEVIKQDRHVLGK